MISKGTQLLLNWGPTLLLRAPDGDLALFGAPDTSKKLSWLQEASYSSQENALRRAPRPPPPPGSAQTGRGVTSLWPA